MNLSPDEIAPTAAATEPSPTTYFPSLASGALPNPCSVARFIDLPVASPALRPALPTSLSFASNLAALASARAKARTSLAVSPVISTFRGMN